MPEWPIGLAWSASVQETVPWVRIPAPPPIFMDTKVILVDEKDNQIGVLDKIDAHQSGKLHRAFSIFIFNSKGQLLLQKRASTKYHSGGLWSNTCCSHPRPNEELEIAAHRRLKEEMGFDCKLKEVYTFIYNVKLENGLTEHEYDHVLVGKSDAKPNLDPKEAEEWKWIDTHLLSEDIKNNPDRYTYWFRISLDEVLARIT